MLRSITSVSLRVRSRQRLCLFFYLFIYVKLPGWFQYTAKFENHRAVQHESTRRVIQDWGGEKKSKHWSQHTCLVSFTRKDSLNARAACLFDNVNSSSCLSTVCLLFHGTKHAVDIQYMLNNNNGLVSAFYYYYYLIVLTIIELASRREVLFSVFQVFEHHSAGQISLT